MGYLYSSTFAGYTPTATTSHGSYPVSRVALIADHPYLRQWRSTAVTQTDLTLDLGTDTSIAGVVLLNANMASCEITTAVASGSPSYSALGPGTYAIQQNTPGPYYNLCVVETVLARYVRIRFPASTPRHVSGHGYYAVGLALVLTTVESLTEPRVGMTETLEARYLETETNVALAGPRWTQEEWDLVWRPDELAAGHALVSLGKHTDVVWFRNNGNRAQVKLLRWVGEVSVTHHGSHYTTSPKWKEHV